MAKLHERWASCPVAGRVSGAFRMSTIQRIVIRSGLHFWLLCLVMTCSGCANYRVGQQSLFRSDIRTVHVPIFESATYRRYLGERLTESVAKEIELNTPYKVVDSLTADSVLTGKIVGMRKSVLSETINDDPRNIEASFRVQVTWTDRRGNILMQRTYNSPSNFIPEGGQSLATAQQDAIEQAARDIVTQMQVWW
jgi:hypothetical protein